MKFFDTSNLRGDITGGLTAGIVALPLALAFGEASGAGPIAGLWGAIIVGFFAALFGGTNTQITGPTGPMVVVFAGVFASLSGNPAYVFAAVVLAGLIQILFGVLKLGQYIRLVPYPVISGFMSGIGVIIILLQTARLFGHEPAGGGTIPAITAIPGAVMDPNFSALIIGLVTLGVIFFWPKSIGKFVPGALAALIIGTLLSFAIPGAPILGDIPTGLPEFMIPSFSGDTFIIVLEAAIILALLGAIDSLLTSLVADNMTRTRHHSERELIGQGIGNAIAGFFGAIPGAGATMRTVVNIRSGGGTRISGMIHSLILVAVVVVLAPLASQIPHAVLAGILVKVGYDIIDVSYLKNAHKGPRWDLVLMAVVLGVTVFIDLIQAVALGVFLAALGFVKQLADEQLQNFAKAEPRVTTDEEREILDRAKGRILLFEFGGPLSFGAAADLGHQVRERSKSLAQAIILDFSSVPFMDVSAARAVETIACDAGKSNKIVYVTGMSDKIAQILNGLDADHCLPADTKYEDRLDALREAIRVIEDSAPKSSDGEITAAE
ncbi:SulP family inorganic anion transporter [Kordiimonas sp. SCSIO 12610]|uniref:SulP family inorganic anion transporter n=1 Tax=Kordiimonas sp. SCSIO 12610 TaxID=2829597 RepID=UPI00210A7C7B|nr:SulP family inorganic anion transporter [Kordiimonas sp. SCSIO 12610]UTW55385.1 SulP family inorganic anion transporter [Kordiimonas sp. SCSIO 12610]